MGEVDWLDFRPVTLVEWAVEILEVWEGGWV